MPLRVKVEMNTFERAPARPTRKRQLAVETAWFTGTTDVPTFALENLNRKRASPPYLQDLRPLVSEWPDGFNAEAAMDVAERFLMATE